MKCFQVHYNSFFLCLVDLHRKKHTADHSNSSAHIKPPLLCTYQGAVYIRTDINYMVTHSCSILALLASAHSSPQPPLPTASHTMLCRETLCSSSHQDTALKSHFLAEEQHLTDLNAVSEIYIYINYTIPSLDTSLQNRGAKPGNHVWLNASTVQPGICTTKTFPSHSSVRKKYPELVTRLLRFST